MKIKDILNLKNVSKFVEGNAKEMYDKLVGLPKHTKQQVMYRLSQCADDCVIEGKCKECGCRLPGKAFVTESCNPERFPNLMNEEDWDKFKEENGIDA